MWRMASAVVGLAAMAGCAGSPADVPDLRGAVTRLERPDAAFESVAVLHVAPAADPAAPAAVVALAGGAEVWDATPLGGSGERRRVDARALAVGQRVEVWYDDPDAGPAPAGATARREARMVVITAPAPAAAP